MSQINDITDPHYNILFEPLPVKQKVKRISKAKVINPVQSILQPDKVSTTDIVTDIVTIVESIIDQCIYIPAKELTVYKCVNESIQLMGSEKQANHITPHNLLIGLINKQKLKEEKQDIWKNSPYKDLVKLQKNNTGNVGEEIIHNICELSGIPVDVDGSKTKKIGGGKGDGIIKGKNVEIKTAHQGCSSTSYQHELGEMPWNADYMIFIDISPLCIYFTIFKNYNEEHYKSEKKCEPYFPTKQVTWRKGKGAFKLDTTISINECNITKGYTFKMTETTNMIELGTFIDLLIE